MNGSWSREEVEATVADYFDMLTMELTGQQFNKTEHRRGLQRRLNNRSDGAIERKHQNISAILIELHCPWIHGYKPLGNYQSLLFGVVEDRLTNMSLFDQAALAAVQMPAAAPSAPDFKSIIVKGQTTRGFVRRRPPPGKAVTPVANSQAPLMRTYSCTL